MAKITISDITSGYASTTQLNNAFNALEAELNNKVLYRDPPAGEPNQMEADLDMNGNKILNAGDIEVNGVNVITEMNNIYNDYEALVNRVTISTASPTGGTEGDIWFKVT
ncbi:hypothetical protein UFOVP454_4 [uncultured Caudovirales phage]|uniref:Uncharacterized protein n=1 Tax=uncultured Caudovirales phage TaxID=2100421 RepID=A0A6J5MCS5_9CAUD|nr:hypothetical protein UFOVP454_4 [uncultured Caudovirales phage]